MRHGLTHMNVSGHVSGHSETHLHPDGIKTTIATGREAYRNGLAIDTVLVSPLWRTVHTAHILAEELRIPENRIIVEPLIIERHFGKGEGAQWHPQINYDEFEGVEPLSDVLARAEEVVRKVCGMHGNVLLVSHGSFGRALRQVLNPHMPYSHPHRLKNSEIIRWL